MSTEVDRPQFEGQLMARLLRRIADSMQQQATIEEKRAAQELSGGERLVDLLEQKPDPQTPNRQVMPASLGLGGNDRVVHDLSIDVSLPSGTEPVSREVVAAVFDQEQSDLQQTIEVDAPQMQEQQPPPAVAEIPQAELLDMLRIDQAANPPPFSPPEFVGQESKPQDSMAAHKPDEQGVFDFPPGALGEDFLKLLKGDGQFNRMPDHFASEPVGTGEMLTFSRDSNETTIKMAEDFADESRQFRQGMMLVLQKLIADLRADYGMLMSIVRHFEQSRRSLR